MQVQTLAKYPEYGFAILEDELGKFLMFEDRDDIIPVGTKLDVPTGEVQDQNLKLSPLSFSPFRLEA